MVKSEEKCSVLVVLWCPAVPNTLWKILHKIGCMSLACSPLALKIAAQMTPERLVLQSTLRPEYKLDVKLKTGGGVGLQSVFAASFALEVAVHNQKKK